MAQATKQFIVNEEGEKTDVILPIVNFLHSSIALSILRGAQ